MIAFVLLSLLFAPAAPIQLGADQILEEPFFSWIQGKRVGLITNQTGVTAQMESLADLLESHPEVSLVALFAPEHGLLGEAQAGEKIAGEAARYSLYGSTRAPTAKMLEGVDVLIFDVQDVGVRFYTYISTLYECMRAAGRHGIPLLVLDRPNPIDATRVEGPLLEPGQESFVGVHPIALRHGMTVGELGRLFNAEAELGCDLKIVPLRGWKRSQWYDQIGLQWIMPSPNMPSLGTATVYPGLCLIEGTNLSEGRGSTRPFELIGAPWLKGTQLARKLNLLGLEGVRFRPQAFRPTFSKFKGEPCLGIQIHVLDRHAFDPLRMVLHLLHQLIRMHPNEFEFKSEIFDRLSGSAAIRESLEQGRSAHEIISGWQQDLTSFRQRRARFLLYD